ncbi:hypothetical protein PAEPH01_0214 [Pancytospora epiphaga]|nr:hypothetical protein PAEPH01_0214 [Pancytospora epiphaga]
MATDKIQEIEREMLGYLDGGDYRLFIQTFTLYLGFSPNTENTVGLRVLACLYYLAFNQAVEGRILIQSINPQDMENVYVQYLLRVLDAVDKCDGVELEKLYKSAVPHSSGLVGLTAARIQKKVTEVLAMDIGRGDVRPQTEDLNRQNIQDCIFVCKEYSKN